LVRSGGARSLLNGEAGDASLLGGPGNDRLVFQDTGQLFGSGRFEGGPGFDMLEIVTWWGLKQGRRMKDISSARWKVR
jgi:hypothetical protein